MDLCWRKQPRASYQIINKFLSHGFESGTRFSRPASGYDRRNEKMSFTGAVGRLVSFIGSYDAGGWGGGEILTLV